MSVGTENRKQKSLGPSVNVIVPIFNAFADLKKCLNSILAAKCEKTSQITLINDASPDPRIQQHIEKIAEAHEHFEVLVNDFNLGYVRTVNKGMRLHLESDVILLNTDTIVCDRWLDKITRAADADERTATVTPFSNNATICSFPSICSENVIPSVFTPALIDRCLERANRWQTLSVPTGHGFCMLIKRAVLNDIGYFNEEIFGAGYGEENDFCMRAAEKGWDNKMCLDTYVHHTGGKSFGSKKQPRVIVALETINRLYQNYEYSVHKFIANDTAHTHRIKALIELYKESSAPKILLISHNLGGGTQEHVQELISFFENQACFLLLKAESNEFIKLFFQVGVVPQSLTFDRKNGFANLISILRYLNVSRVHFHHTMGLGQKILDIPRVLRLAYDVTLHDYYCIDGNPTQTDVDGVFCDFRGSRNRLMQKQYRKRPMRWRKKQQELLLNAARVFAPSSYVSAYYQAYLPPLRTIVALHPEHERNAPYPGVTPRQLARNQNMKILVIGAINKEKGADAFERVAVHMARQKCPCEFHLLGYAYRKLKACVCAHGRYKRKDVVNKIEEIEPHLIWIPSRWPETYSYTLSEAFWCGLPLVVPDVGCFPERIQNRPLTWVVPWNHSVEQGVDVFKRIRSELSRLTDRTTRPWFDQPGEGTAFTYKQHYVVETLHNKKPVEFDVDFAVSQCMVRKEGVLTVKENMLLQLLRLKHNKFIRFCVDHTPEPVILGAKSMFTSRTFENLEEKGGLK